jgi:uncharacterized protein YjiS (DUF1127 family)
MTTNIRVLPLAGATLARGFTGLALQAARLANAVRQGLKNRRDARMLASFDNRMLADIGLSRSDINDAFSAPFWEDPTDLLRERVQERRLYRHVVPPPRRRGLEPGFKRPNTTRPALHAF